MSIVSHHVAFGRGSDTSLTQAQVKRRQWPAPLRSSPPPQPVAAPHLRVVTETLSLSLSLSPMLWVSARRLAIATQGGGVTVRVRCQRGGASRASALARHSTRLCARLEPRLKPWTASARCQTRVSMRPSDSELPPRPPHREDQSSAQDRSHPACRVSWDGIRFEHRRSRWSWRRRITGRLLSAS